MNALECIRSRRSIHAFLPKPVEFDKVVAILEAAQHAPSAGNLQDWRFLVVTDHNKIAQLPAECGGQSCINAPLVIVVCSDPVQVNQQFPDRGHVYTIQNAAAATQNILLAAHALGLGSVWVGAFVADNIRKLFGVPKNVQVHALLGIGYADEKPTTKTLANLDSMVYFNSYGNRLKDIHLALGEYGESLKARLAERKGPKSLETTADQASSQRLPPQAAVAQLGHHLRRIRNEIRSRTKK